MRFPTCIALESKWVWSCINIPFFFFLIGETPAPSTALKSIIRHQGTQMSPAALPEVCDYYVTRTKGCCWQKLPEPKPWDYLLVSRTALLKQPEGSQSVLSSCFQISSLFLFLCFFIYYLTLTASTQVSYPGDCFKTPFPTLLLEG